jgi:hypothetical protein
VWQLPIPLSAWVRETQRRRVVVCALVVGATTQAVHTALPSTWCARAVLLQLVGSSRHVGRAGLSLNSSMLSTVRACTCGASEQSRCVRLAVCLYHLVTTWPLIIMWWHRAERSAAAAAQPSCEPSPSMRSRRMCKVSPPSARSLPSSAPPSAQTPGRYDEREQTQTLCQDRRLSSIPLPPKRVLLLHYCCLQHFPLSQSHTASMLCQSSANRAEQQQKKPRMQRPPAI